MELQGEDGMPDITAKELTARIEQILLEHPNDQGKWVEGLYETIKNEPMTVLRQLVGEDAIKRLLDGYFEEMKDPA